MYRFGTDGLARTGLAFNNGLLVELGNVLDAWLVVEMTSGVVVVGLVVVVTAGACVVELTGSIRGGTVVVVGNSVGVTVVVGDSRSGIARSGCLVVVGCFIFSFMFSPLDDWFLDAGNGLLFWRMGISFRLLFSLLSELTFSFCRGLTGI